MKGKSLEITVGIFVLIGIACIGYLTIKLGKMEFIGDQSYKIYARFETASGLTRGANVEMAGVNIGRVRSITLDKESMAALVGLEIKNEIVITDDVIASIKTAGIIGDKYIRLAPGGSDEILKPGDTIIETESALDLEELISKYVFDKL